MPPLDTSAGMLYLGIKHRSNWQIHTCLRAIALHMREGTRQRHGGSTFKCRRCGREDTEVKVEEQLGSDGTIFLQFRVRDKALGENRPYTEQETRIGEGHKVSNQIQSRFLIAGNDFTIFVLTWVGLDGSVLTLVEPAEFPDLERELQRCLTFIRRPVARATEEVELDDGDVIDDDAEFSRWLSAHRHHLRAHQGSEARDSDETEE